MQTEPCSAGVTTRGAAQQDNAVDAFGPEPVRFSILLRLSGQVS